MRPHDDTASLTPAEQLRQLARVLAAGLLRLRRPVPSTVGQPLGPKNLPNSSENPLELPEDLRLSGHTG
jgi:hypothetical protein